MDAFTVAKVETIEKIKGLFLTTMCAIHKHTHILAHALQVNDLLF